jgi:hypothetical protein
VNPHIPEVAIPPGMTTASAGSQGTAGAPQPFVRHGCGLKRNVKQMCRIVQDLMDPICLGPGQQASEQPSHNVKYRLP